MHCFDCNCILCITQQTQTKKFLSSSLTIIYNIYHTPHRKGSRNWQQLRLPLKASHALRWNEPIPQLQNLICGKKIYHQGLSPERISIGSAAGLPQYFASTVMHCFTSISRQKVTTCPPPSTFFAFSGVSSKSSNFSMFNFCVLIVLKVQIVIQKCIYPFTFTDNMRLGCSLLAQPTAFCHCPAPLPPHVCIPNAGGWPASMRRMPAQAVVAMAGFMGSILIIKSFIAPTQYI